MASAIMSGFLNIPLTWAYQLASRGALTLVSGGLVSRIWKTTATLVIIAALGVITAGSALAAPGGNGNGKGNGNGTNPPSVASTPELESIALFATGAAGMAGYALTRFRSRKR
jgi:hypothetical protein